MSEHVHVFVYAPAHFEGVGSSAVRADSVRGTLFDVEGIGPALMLAGHASVPGEVRRIDPEAVARVDRTLRVADGIYRRVGVRIGQTPCWAWIAGPRLAQRLASSKSSSQEET